MKSASETKRKFLARRSGRDSKNTRGAFSPSFLTYSDSCSCQASQQIFHGQASSTATLAVQRCSAQNKAHRQQCLGYVVGATQLSAAPLKLCLAKPCPNQGVP